MNKIISVRNNIPFISTILYTQDDTVFYTGCYYRKYSNNISNIKLFPYDQLTSKYVYILVGESDNGYDATNYYDIHWFLDLDKAMEIVDNLESGKLKFRDFCKEYDAKTDVDHKHDSYHIRVDRIDDMSNK